MALEVPEEAQPERAYAYWPGWHNVGCSVLLYGLIGSIGVSLFPTGVEKVRAGQLPTGVALIVLAIFGVPTLAMAVWSVISGVRDTFRPPRLRVTTTALILPQSARGEPLEDVHGLPTKELQHPETIPFMAIRRVTRTGPRFNGVLDVTHDLSTTALKIYQHMMRAADFDELERILRAAAPDAFAGAPPAAPGGGA
jgi:hypothetical protein